MKHKVITITPLGRRKYINILAPYLLNNSHIIDKHIFWLNTDNTYDISTAYSWANRYPDFFSVQTQNNFALKTDTINNIYTYFNEYDTIYIKLNDDICWLHDKAIENLVNFRETNREYFLIYPMIINSGRTASLHQIMGHLPLNLTGEWPGAYRDYFDIKSKHPQVSQKIHECFLDKLRNGNVDELFISKYILYDYEYLPEHCVCWFGKDFKHLSMPHIGEYNFLSSIETSLRGKLSCICGNSLISHFSFSNHEKFLLDSTDLYDIYNNMSKGAK